MAGSFGLEQHLDNALRTERTLLRVAVASIREYPYWPFLVTVFKSATALTQRYVRVTTPARVASRA